MHMDQAEPLKPSVVKLIEIGDRYSRPWSERRLNFERKSKMLKVMNRVIRSAPRVEQGGLFFKKCLEDMQLAHQPDSLTASHAAASRSEERSPRLKPENHRFHPVRGMLRGRICQDVSTQCPKQVTLVVVLQRQHKAKPVLQRRPRAAHSSCLELKVSCRSPGRQLKKQTWALIRRAERCVRVERFRTIYPQRNEAPSASPGQAQSVPERLKITSSEIHRFLSFCSTVFSR